MRSPMNYAAIRTTAFRQLQRAHVPNLTKAEWLDLFDEWRPPYRGRREAAAAARPARVAKLWDELGALHIERASLPLEQHAAVTARIEALAREIAAAIAPRELPSLATWG